MSGRAVAAASTVWPSAGDGLPAEMRTVAVTRLGGPEVLEVRTLPTPVAGPGEVLVRVAAVSVGRLLDLSVRTGTHPTARPALPHVLGAEHAGTVVAVGPGVENVAGGERVAVFPALSCGHCADCRDGVGEACPSMQIIGVHRPGAYAEYTVVPASAVHVVPDDLDPVTAAALALSGPVAMNQLSQAGLRPGDWVLVQGAASALGTLTAALARRLGARVIGASRSARKREMLAVDAALDPTSGAFVDDVLALTDGRGVEVAIDNLGEPQVWARTTAVLANRGTVVSSGAFLGGVVELDLRRLYLRNQRVLGVRTGNARSADALWAEVGRGFRPVVDRTFPAARAADAHRYLEADDNLGRVVLTTGAPDDWADRP